MLDPASTFIDDRVELARDGAEQGVVLRGTTTIGAGARWAHSVLTDTLWRPAKRCRPHHEALKSRLACPGALLHRTVHGALQTPRTAGPRGWHRYYGYAPGASGRASARWSQHPMTATKRF